MSTGSVPEDGGRPSAIRPQHAIRLLTLLAECGETTNESDPAGTVKVVRSELRVQAMAPFLSSNRKAHKPGVVM